MQFYIQNLALYKSEKQYFKWQQIKTKINFDKKKTFLKALQRFEPMNPVILLQLSYQLSNEVNPQLEMTFWVHQCYSEVYNNYVTENSKFYFLKVLMTTKSNINSNLAHRVVRITIAQQTLNTPTPYSK